MAKDTAAPRPDLMAQAGQAPNELPELPGRHRLLQRLVAWHRIRVAKSSTERTNQRIAKIDNPWLLDRLAHDPDSRIVGGVALNPHLPTQTIRHLAGSDSDLIRMRMARRLDLPADTMQQLAHDEYMVVRAELARNATASPEVIAYIARNDPHPPNRAHALKNPNCPPQLKALADLL